MLGTLDFLGTVGGNVLSLPGFVGLALGMMTRNWIVAALLGAAIGVVETLIFNRFDMAAINVFDLLIAVLVGVVASLMGCAIRHKGALV